MNASPQFLTDLSFLVLSEAGGLTRIPLAMVGTFWKGKQRFTITRADVIAMAENLAKRGNGDVVLDYEHASEMPEVAAGGPIPAAGWIKSIDSQPDVGHVVWAQVELTEKARTMIEAKEYKYISPSINWGARDKSTGEQQGATLTSAALTNTPVLDRMPAIRLSNAWTEGDKTAMAKENVMCSEHPDKKLLCPTCDASTIQTLTASERGGSMLIQLSEVGRDERGVFDGDALAALDERAFVPVVLLREMEKQRIALSEVQSAFAEGKILPFQRKHFEHIALGNIETFRGVVKGMKPQIDLSERGLAGSGIEGSAGAELEAVNTRLADLTTIKARELNIPYTDASKLVASEHRDLSLRRAVLTRTSS